MLRAITILTVLLLCVCVAEISCQRPVYAVYRRPATPPSPPKIQRARRSVSSDTSEPLWLYKGDNIERTPATGDHPYLPPYIDDVKLDPNTRVARSVDSPSAKHGGGSYSTSSGSKDTGATHPGYNRRNTRDIRIPQPFSPFPKPLLPKPTRPFFPSPINQAQALLKKPTHYDITFTGWNPNAKVEKWQKVKIRRD